MEHKSPKNTATLITIVLGVVAVVLAIGVIVLFTQVQQLKKNPNAVSEQETKDLVAKVSKIYELPKDETPTVATIVDKDKLKDQPFFSNAQNGDKILIFTKAKKAIIYRPKENRIINSGPIAIDQKAQIPVGIVNAGGDTNEAQKKLNDKFNGSINIVGVSDAKNKNSVKQITVVDVSGQNAEGAKSIAELLGGTVAAMPAGEPTPQGASIVVFVK